MKVSTRYQDQDFTTPFSYELADFSFDFSYMLSQIKPEGKLVYEYNPFRNFRISKDREIPEGHPDYIKGGINILEKGSLTDFETELLNFSLNSPIDLIVQPSYDGSVNLILEDDCNIPRLINSRFTALPHNTYRIVDRTGNTDTNIYDEDQFELDTSLYKRVDSIPTVTFNGLDYGGNLKVGNYVFYFKLSDADGNETDFVAESGIVTCYIGNINDPNSIRGGIGDENSYKTVSFFLNNLDSSYDFVSVYYTRSTSSSEGAESTSAHRIDRKFRVKNETCSVSITGFESSNQISIDDINIQYFIASRSKTQAACQNILFLGGVSKPTIPYEDLQDISLRFLPYYTATKSSDLIGELDYRYIDISTSLKNKYEYYNSKNIYSYLGYWNEEIYRLGVVYILPDSTLTPVFNVRGKNAIPQLEDVFNGDSYSLENYNIKDEFEKRVLITVDESSYQIGKESSKLENSKGVVRIEDNTSTGYSVYGVGLVIPMEVVDYLKELGIKGMFFVRQKRIPTILAQALTVGFDKNAGIPLLTTVNDSGLAESFMNIHGTLTNNYKERLVSSTKNTSKEAAICPEYSLKQPFFNNIFTGTSFTVKECTVQYLGNLKNDPVDDRHYYLIGNTNSSNSQEWNDIYITAVGDNIPVIRDKYNLYRARAGEAEEAFKFIWIESDSEIKYGKNANKVIRGSFGPYLGMSLYRGAANKLLNIYIPNYQISSMGSYFGVRYEDNSPYYSIGDRIDFKNIRYEIGTLKVAHMNNLICYYLNQYRGDCFICNYTHRLNRNFQDPEAPNNDEIVDPNTFKDNYTKGDSEKNAKINRGDVNAVQLGSWITFKVYSSINLSMRNWDDSYISENGLTGMNRSFYPLSSMSTEGNTKIPESFVINTGESSTTSDKYNFILPDVPYIKNEFGTRIVYSDVAVNDAFKNGFRVFQANHYRDYPMIYGGIMKLVELYGNLLCVFEHGVALIPVNERAIAGEGAGGNVYINTSNVLPENPKMLSDMFGSQWPESVIKTPYYVYGVDTVAKKIWRTNGQQFEVISDFKIQKFLNDNITLSERELTPIIGVRNVKTHYNVFKGDVMFTFYDNLYGFEEKAWNICYNEIMQKWITLYSWMPSYSENIDNIFFSFNRNTSKWISKLGTTNAASTSADGITLSNVVFEKAGDKAYLGLANRALPNDKGTSLPDVYFEYSLIDDNFGNRKMFRIGEEDDIFDGKTVKKAYLYFVGNQEELESKQVWLLNVKVEIKIADYSGEDTNIKNYINGWKEYTTINYGYYQSVIAVTSHKVFNNPMLTEEEKQSPNLSTDFWKHGQSGIIDIKEKIRPCYWYGEQHPFEFEYVVADKPGVHKIFTNLQLISNKAKPESFHYEIVGESYDWADDKKNMYVRQEATKKLYQNLGSDILYNRNYEELAEGKYVIEQDPETNKNKLVYKTPGIKCNPKSTIFPWYYERIDTFNDIYDCYQRATSKYGREYQNLSGTEVIYDEQLNEFRLWTHSKAWDMKEVGRLRGNCQYQEDLWLVVIPSINFRQKNENWEKLPPIILNNIPNDIKEDTITTESLPKFNH